MNHRMRFLIAAVLFASIACQVLTGPFATNDSISTATPEEIIPQASPTLEPITEKSLAGLMVYSPALGVAPGPYMGDVPIKGLGIVNKNGDLIKITEAGLFKGYSPSGPHIIFQFYEINSSSNDKLRSFNIDSGETVEIANELEGQKTILGWHPSAPSKFVYENSLDQYLFEAYGYFEGRQILLADAETGEATLLLEHTFQSDLSPDRTQLAYTTGQITETSSEHMQAGAGCFQPHIYHLDDSSTSTFVTSQLTEAPLCLAYPNWSPEGDRIAWIGYFADDTFRTVIFNTSDGTGTIQGELKAYAGSQFPSGWTIGQIMWIDNSTFWTNDYEINVETDKTTLPRENPIPFEHPVDRYFSDFVTRPDGLLVTTLGDGDGKLTLSDAQGNQLAVYSLDQLYQGERNDFGFDGTEYTASYITGWLPFAPEAGIESNVQSNAPTPDNFACPDAPRTRLAVGDTARITFTDGTSTFLRSKPESGGNVIDKLPEGTEFEIISGPICYPRPGRNDAYIYWEISVPSRNIKGWVAEGDSQNYYIEPWP